MKRKNAVLVTLGLMLAIVGCGGPSSNENEAGNAVLKIGIGIIPTTLDPGRNNFRQAFSILSLTSGTLTKVERDGKISMRLAASMEPGDKQFVFKLKPGLKFSDGSALTARDVVATFEHLLADKTNPSASTYAAVEKVKATDDLTVEFDLNRPYPWLPNNLGSTAILPAKFIESKGADLYKGDPPPTAGQFVVQTMGQDQITLQANPNYAGEQPSTKTLVFNKIIDPASRLAQVRGGQIDFADDITAKSIGQLSPPLEVNTAASLNGSQLLVMNTKGTGTLSDVRIRKAISLAIDRNQISQVAWAGQARPTLSLFSQDSPYNTPFVSADADIQHAKEQLAGTNCANGCTLRLIVSSTNEPRSDAAVVVQQNLKAIGIQVNIEKSEAATFLKSFKDGNYDLASSGNADSNPDSYLRYALGPVSDALHSFYSSPEMDGLLKQISISSGPELATAVGRVNALVGKDMPMTPLAEYSITSVSRVPSERFYMDQAFNFNVG